MKRYRVVVLASVGLLTVGCAQYREQWEAALRSRAAFELSCDQSKLKITPLTTETLGVSDAPLYEGVEGCGKKAVYVATVSGYVLNSNGAGAEIAAQPPPAPPPPPPPPPPAH